ncbi:MAG: type I asparaginase [Hymenobacteraceae bacterium]|nr:type I asparaginase [Hymenobacteraceae bacterium]
MQYSQIELDSAAPAGAPSLLLIYTGGTIGMAVTREDEHLVAFDFTRLLKHIPELHLFRVRLTVLSRAEPIDSSDITTTDWLELAALIAAHYDSYDGFVVLHGTDTMAYSASALSFLLENLGKPVVFTGAQVPVGRVRTDARENLLSALEIAALRGPDGQPVVPEVSIFFHRQLLRGNRSKKVESNFFDAFKSENYPVLIKAGVALEVNHAALAPLPIGAFRAHTVLDTRVAVLKLFPGISESVVRAVLDLPDLRGVVLETYGSGNAPTAAWFLAALRRTVARGVLVLNVSQCDEGHVDQTRYSTGVGLAEAGVLGGEDITTEAAIAKLMFILAQNPVDIDAARSMLTRNLRGEISVG